MMGAVKKGQRRGKSDVLDKFKEQQNDRRGSGRVSEAESRASLHRADGDALRCWRSERWWVVLDVEG